MHVFYVDDSKDNKLAVFSALSIPVDQWRTCFRIVKGFRSLINEKHGIPMRAEFHATDFVAGRGRLRRDGIVTKWDRCEIFKHSLAMIAELPGASIINVCGPRANENKAFEYLLNRIDMAMRRASSHAVVFSDQGKEGEYTRLARKMAVFNPIPSRYGIWSNGEKTRNIPIEHVIEDIVFKDSKSSYFVQLADFCAFSLLRRENPIESRTRYGLDKAFDLLDPVLNRNASRNDPDGIVRC
jgi:hypothetical protein